MAFDLSILDETVQRWRSFAAKIRQRADELHSQGFEEARAMKRQAASDNDNAHYLFWSGIGGQIGTLRTKVEETFARSVQAAFEQKAGNLVASWGRYDIRKEAEDLWHQLQEERNALDSHLLNLSCTNIADFDDPEDAEARYRDILREHEQLKDRFACITCGAGIPISKLFFIATYVDCPYCRTRNTFQPGTAACGLPTLAEQLAEQRTLELRRRWEAAAAGMPLWSAQNSDAWHAQKRREVDLHVAYLDAKFDEIDRIVPDLKPQNDLVRAGRIEDVRRVIRSSFTTPTPQ